MAKSRLRSNEGLGDLPICLVGKRKRRKVVCSVCLHFVSSCDSVAVGYAIETKESVSQIRHPSLSRSRVNPWS